MTLERTILPLNLFTICINPKEHNNFSRELFNFSCNIKKESNKVKENSGRRCRIEVNGSNKPKYFIITQEATTSSATTCLDRDQQK